MMFPSAAVMPSYNDSPIQQTAGQFRPIVFMAEVGDNRANSVTGSVGNVTFEASGEFRQFIKSDLEGRLSTVGVPLARSRSDAQSQSNVNRQVVASIRSTSYGAATALLHKTVAGINLLVKVVDENGRPVFAQTYFGSASKYPALASAKQSGEMMAKAVRQATDKAMRDSEFRAAIGL
jgi:predicted secreted protein